jgi:uncharacterized iron-regulated membrane protein
MANLRKLHKRVALTFSPFFLITSITGILLLFRKDNLFSKETKELLLGIHNWELGAKYIGLVLGLALIFVTCTGLMIHFKKR